MKRTLTLLVSMLLLTGCSTIDNTPDVVPSELNVETNVNAKEDDEAYLNQYLDSFINDGYVLPSKTYKEKDISWEIIEGEAIIEEFVVHKTDKADEYEKIKLMAHVEDESYSYENIMLLDPYVGYLMAYFTGEGDTKETLKYAFTYNGDLWYVFNDEQPVLKATLGTKRIRDPYIMRKKDGSFTFLATEGYDNPNIYAFDTNDLVHFENERMIQVNYSTESNPMSEKQAWAPEGFYDRIIDKYVIYWSSPEDGTMYYNYSSDLNDISSPKKLLDTGFTVIDGTIVKEGYDYTIILKDERQPMEVYSQLFLGYSDTDYLGFDDFDMNFITGHQSEGPFVIKRDYDKVIFYDDYTRAQFQGISYYDLHDTSTFDDINMLDIIFPMEEVKHARVIPITYNEWLKVANEYSE